MRTKNGNLGNLIWTEPKKNVKKQLTRIDLEDDKGFIKAMAKFSEIINEAQQKEIEGREGIKVISASKILDGQD